MATDAMKRNRRQPSKRISRAALLASTVVPEGTGTTEPTTEPTTVDATMLASGGNASNYAVASLRAELEPLIDTEQRLDGAKDRNGQRLVHLIDKAYRIYIAANDADVPAIHEMIEAPKRKQTQSARDFVSRLRGDLLGANPGKASISTSTPERNRKRDFYNAGVTAINRAFKVWLAVKLHTTTPDGEIWSTEYDAIMAPTVAFLPKDAPNVPIETAWKYYVDGTDMPDRIPLIGGSYEITRIRDPQGKRERDFHAYRFTFANLHDNYFLTPEHLRGKQTVPVAATVTTTDGTTPAQNADATATTTVPSADDNRADQMQRAERRKLIGATDVLEILAAMAPLVKPENGPQWTMRDFDDKPQALEALRELHLLYIHMTAQSVQNAAAPTPAVPTSTASRREFNPAMLTGTVVPLSVPTKADKPLSATEAKRLAKAKLMTMASPPTARKAAQRKRA